MPGGRPGSRSQELSQSTSNVNVHVEDVYFVEDDSFAIHREINNVSNNNLKSQVALSNSLSLTNKNMPDKNDMSEKSNPSEKQRSRFLDLSNRFKNTDSGPYLIFVEHITLNIGRLHPMKLGEKLINLSEYDKHILEISNVGRNRIKIEVKSADIANKLVVEPFFKDNDLVAYIPSYLTEKKGIVRFVDTSYSEETLFNIIKSDIPIKKVQRMHKIVNNDGTQERVARQMIIVTFSGIHIPQFIYINKVRCEVNVYIQPVMQCYQCLRYGHSARQCKGKKRCRKCGSYNENECLDCSNFCVFCNEDSHNSTYKDCPEYRKQKRTKEAMARLNVSFKEAQKLIDNPAYTSIVQRNRYAPLIDSNVEFPPLKSSGARNISQNTSNVIKRTGLVPSQHNPIINPNKKRKKSLDSTPHFPPISREYKTSFCAGPVINCGNKDTSVDVDSLKNKLALELKELVKYIVNDLQISTPSTSSSQVVDSFNLEDILDNMVNKLFS